MNEPTPQPEPAQSPPDAAQAEGVGARVMETLRALKQDRSARHAISLAWLIIRRAPLLIIARLGLDFIKGMLSLLIFALILSALGVQVWTVMQGASLDALLGAWRQPGVWLGLGGALASYTALGLITDALGDALTWGALRQLLARFAGEEADATEAEAGAAGEARAAGEAPKPNASMWRVRWGDAALEHLPRAVVWRAFRAAVQWGVIVLGGMVYVSLILLNDPTASNAALKVPVLSFFYAALIVWTALVLATLEVIPALYSRGELDLGESALEAAGMVVERLVTLYRMAVLSALVAVPALVLWAGFMVMQASVASQPEALNALAPLRLIADGLLSVSMMLAGLLWRAGVFALEASRRGALPPIEALERDVTRRDRLERALRGGPTRPGQPHRPAALGHLDMQTGQWVVSLEDLRPTTTPNIFSFAQALGAPIPSDDADTSADARPDDARLDDPTLTAPAAAPRASGEDE